MGNLNQPKVSIVLPTYNGAAFIKQSIESCLAQTYQNIELIIVNDGSTDNTLEQIESFNNHRIILIKQDKNQGHIAALNKGFSVSSGDLLTWTSDDNYYALNAIAVMAEELNKHKDIDFVYSKYQVINPKGEPLRIGRFEDPDYLDIDNCIGGCFLYRRKVYEAVGDFNPEAFLAEDYEYWLRVRQKFGMKKIDAVLYYYREHDKSLTGVHKEQKVAAQVQKVRNRFIPLWKRAGRKLKKILGA
jgi:glycosyltransferase involved in cell wall biosynthesis